MYNAFLASGVENPSVPRRYLMRSAIKKGTLRILTCDMGIILSMDVVSGAIQPTKNKHPI